MNNSIPFFILRKYEKRLLLSLNMIVIPGIAVKCPAMYTTTGPSKLRHAASNIFFSHWRITFLITLHSPTCLCDWSNQLNEYMYPSTMQLIKSPVCSHYVYQMQWPGTNLITMMIQFETSELMFFQYSQLNSQPLCMFRR
jgi:hypothetical protein